MGDATIGDIYKPNTGLDVNTPYDEDGKDAVKVEDFLQLMIAQLRNQDFTNPVDDTQYVTQLAQFASMQQMQELAYYSKTNYAMGLVGKTVTVASYAMGGNVKKEIGAVEKVSLVNKEYIITVGGKDFKLNQIMSVGDGSPNVNEDTKLTPVLLKKNADSAEIRWDAPTQDELDQKKFTYQVYYSEDQKFDSLDDVKKGTLAGTIDPGDETQYEIKGLKPGKTYYVNIVGTTAAGKETVYSKLVFETSKE
ncbi:MAG: flagellar hook capping FlgD N-terminal domain-containing protein [Oscillospiraceae bacterium]